VYEVIGRVGGVIGKRVAVTLQVSQMRYKSCTYASAYGLPISR
jgi:hypothetical protein